MIWARPGRAVCTAFVTLLAVICPEFVAPGQSIGSLAALTNLQALVNRVPVGLNPYSGQGPKGIESADFNRDGTNDLAVSNTDGSVTVLIALGDGKFAAPRHLRTPESLGGAGSLRGIVTADFDQDGYPDIATAAPVEGKVFLFFHTNGPGEFTMPRVLPTWHGARNLEAGDFDGDGRMDLAVAGPNNGLRQYRGMPGGDFVVVTNVPGLNFTNEAPERFPKPLYSLQRMRPPDSSRDWLVAGHAEGTNIWILKPNPQGALEVSTTVAGRANLHGLAVGPVYHPIDSGVPDLVTVLRDTGVIDVHMGTNSAAGFAIHPAGNKDFRIREYVPGGPRAVSLVDLNGDGWNDLVVAVRNLDSIETYLNDTRGGLVRTNSRPVGTSPRELVTADFNGDSRPDVAVMNRESSDLTVLLASDQGGGYRAVDNLYLVDGQVVGLAVLDFNNDGFDDVVQLHQASGDFSVRLARPDFSGRLQDPVFYTVGNVPAAQVLVDVNGDHLPDVVTANLGTRLVERGSVSVLLGQTNAPGTLGSELRIELREGVEGRLFALVPGDFNRDGSIDLVVGFLDGKLAFFQGSGNGEFTHALTRRIFVEGSAGALPRSLTAEDFDQDGDLDLAGLDATGEMWVMENPWSLENPSQDLLTPGGIAVRRFVPPYSTGIGGRKIVSTAYNPEDSIPDLIIGSGRDAWFYQGLGGPGATNFAAPTRLAGISNLVSDFLLKDLDGDGNPDLVMSCRELDCFSVFSSRQGLAVGLPYDAPSSRFIGVGDLDRDGKPDFVGSGRVLWTSLSSRPAQPSPPLVPSDGRPTISTVVINEVLASNTELPVDEGRTSEWFELYNGGSARSLTGWSVSLEFVDDAGEQVTTNFRFPPTAFLAGGAHLLIICSIEKRTLYHTGFRLPAGGGTLILRDETNHIIDRVTYPPQRPNISYARYRDALRSFVFNPFPSPRLSNPVNGTAEPTLEFGGVDPASFQPGQPIRFYAEVAEDIGAASLVMHYQTLGWRESSERAQLQLFDDGQHGDGAAGDGRFAGELPFRLTTPTELQFFFELTDLNDVTVEAPEDPEFGTPDALGSAYQLGFVQPRPAIEISEIVAWNTEGLQDGTNGRPDWLEIRNPSDRRVALKEVSLSQQIGDNARYHFPADYWLEAGEHLVVLCDNRPDRGANHAPIALSRGGDTVMLTGLTTNGSRMLIDAVSYGPQDPNIAWARLGASGLFWKLAPTPTNGNVAPRIVDHTNRAWVGQIRATGGALEGVIGIPTQRGVACTVEYSTALHPDQWIGIAQFVGDGVERVYTWPLTNAAFFRWR